MRVGFGKRGLILAAIIGLTGCIDHDSRPLTIAQKNFISERIKPFSVVNVEGQGILQVAMAEELPGQAKYAGCTACHGAQGQGGVGPMLAGQSSIDIVGKLTTYKTRGQIGPMSQMMWGQAENLSDDDIQTIGDFVEANFPSE